MASVYINAFLQVLLEVVVHAPPQVLIIICKFVNYGFFEFFNIHDTSLEHTVFQERRRLVHSGRAMELAKQFCRNVRSQFQTFDQLQLYNTFSCSVGCCSILVLM